MVDPSYLQLLVQLPPEASALNTVFVHDYFRSFTETIFFGNEVRGLRTLPGQQQLLQDDELEMSSVNPLINPACANPSLPPQVRLFVFEALFFMSIELALNNAAVSALITYVMVRAVALIRKFFGTLNLSQKTTVDLHFLV